MGPYERVSGVMARWVPGWLGATLNDLVSVACLKRRQALRPNLPSST